MIDLDVYSDVYKSAFGVRPSENRLLAMLSSTPDEYAEEMASLDRYLRATMEYDAIQERKAFKGLVEKVQKVAEDSGVSFAKATEWFQEADEALDSVEFFLYINGISSGALINEYEKLMATVN